MIGKAKRLFTEPKNALFRLRARLLPGSLHQRYQYLAREQGFKRAHFLLTFDCDTDLDIAVVGDVHNKLHQIGITPVYAVPGELLERGAIAYRAIADMGAEFINHGYREHAVFDGSTNNYVSTVFYDQLTNSEVVNDIRRGHQSVINIIGRCPTGFRVPHFGTYAKQTQLNFLYEQLEILGYRFSSSSLPQLGFEQGPAKRLGSSLCELPVTGCHDKPLHILDSWGFRFAPGRTVNQNDYIIQLNKITRHFLDSHRVGLINLYADPSQVYDWPEFFEALRPLAQIAAGSFEQVLKEIQHE
jgi:hypothetical protein